MNSTERPFGVYIHWPFCAQKCPYCDFNSHVRHEGWDEARFLKAYVRELSTIAAMQRDMGSLPRATSSIFFGGGTPSLMKPETVAALIESVDRLWPIADGAEITLEANPNSVEADRFRGYKSAGVNRVSVGVQSLRDAELKKLGRLHSVEEAKRAIEIAKRTFERVSFDLIYARPSQTVADWRIELQEALSLAGDHLSLYQLTIEPETPFEKLAAAGKLQVPDADTAFDLFAVTQELTSAHGLAAYEISNHARPGEESQHNLLYWRYGTYAGAGPGAHGRLDTGITRMATVTERSPEKWAALVEDKGHGFVEETLLAPEEAADEMLLMGLRLSEGIDLDGLAQIGGLVPSDDQIDELVMMRFLERIEHGQGRAPRLRATGHGRFILNELVLRLSDSFEPVAPKHPSQPVA